MRTLLLTLLVACAHPSAPAAEAVSDASAGVDAQDAQLAVDAAPPQIDPDGNDDRSSSPSSGTVPAHGHFERVGRTWASLTRICDLTPFQGSLFAAHAIAPLGADGATLTRYTKGEAADGGVSSTFAIAFDWNRPGEPKGGGGSGQGFIRIRSIGGRLLVPDSDPPYDGFGIADHGTEGYVFMSDEQGKFGKPTGEHFHPPLGTGVVTRAYHDLDVIRFRGKTYVSTGAVPPGERAWSGPSPGALHVASDDFSRWTYVVGYPKDATRDVWRLTFLVRFRDRLYAGIQEYYPREPNDYVVISPPRDATTITAADVRGVKVTPSGGTQTLRWYADQGSLYWVGIDRDGTGMLRVTHDGDTWEDMDVPDDAGRPADIIRFRDSLVVLTENGLYRVKPSGAFEPVGSWTDKKLFPVDDLFCAPPLGVYQDELYAGSQKDGSLMRFVADPLP